MPNGVDQTNSSNAETGGTEPEPDPTLINDELKATTTIERTFSGWEMASLWIGLVVGVPTYYLAGSLVDLGMAWWQGIATVVAANLILLVPLVLTGEPGVRYGIPFPVLARSSFGIRGAHVPTILRALVGCGWYGIETWIGGQAIFLLLPNFKKLKKWRKGSQASSSCSFEKRKAKRRNMKRASTSTKASKLLPLRGLKMEPSFAD